MKTRNDFRLQFNKEKQLHVLITDGTGYIHYSDDYVHWLEELAMKQANGDSTDERQSNISDVSNNNVAVCDCHKGKFVFNEVQQILICGCGRRIKITN